MSEVAVVHSGGGSGGAFGLGVMRNLYDRGYSIKHGYGISVGALNLFADSYIGIEGIEDIWLNQIKKRSDILKLNWCRPWADGLYSTKPLKKIIDRVAYDSFPKYPVSVGYADYAQGGIKYASSDGPEFPEKVWASASMPIVMEMVGKRWVDGGVYDITPLKRAIEDGHENIVVILAQEFNFNPSQVEYPKTFLKLPKVAERIVGLLVHQVFVNDLKLCLERNNNPNFKKINLEIYAPKPRIIGTLDFTQDKIKPAYLQGLESVGIKG